MPDVTLKTVSQLLEASIKLERRIGDLYYLFSQIYPEDKEFWNQLAEEEDKHAQVLEGLRPWAAMGGNIDPLLLSDFRELKARNIAIKKVFEQIRKHTPPKDVAFNAAYQLELTASEIHFQKMITEDTDNKLLLSMQELCGADKDHMKRIKTRMDKLGIEVIKD